MTPDTEALTSDPTPAGAVVVAGRSAAASAAADAISGSIRV
ncbi:MAG TPA: hypothetical protein VMV09_07595 [Candidatus Saccharimonadales bacterium]|nr:hypothetical protein [Candidatus Saccharimonadales bacterium]